MTPPLSLSLSVRGRNFQPREQTIQGEYLVPAGRLRLLASQAAQYNYVSLSLHLSSSVYLYIIIISAITSQAGQFVKPVPFPLLMGNSPCFQHLLCKQKSLQGEERGFVLFHRYIDRGEQPDKQGQSCKGQLGAIHYQNLELQYSKQHGLSFRRVLYINKKIYTSKIMFILLIF